MSKPTLNHLLNLYTSGSTEIDIVADLLAFWCYFENPIYAYEFLRQYQPIPTSTIVWFKPSDKLPEIPKKQYAISVLIVTHDHVYEELCPKKGSDLSMCHYGPVNNSTKNSFYTLVGILGTLDYREESICDRIIYWAYIPDVNKLPVPKL